MNRTYDCPNCGGAVAFQSSIAVFAVCPYCRSMVVRHDVSVEAIGQMAQLPPDLSPLQIGARGQFDGQAFTLVGRVRLAYDEGSWNEWFALFGDGRYGWVAEAQGFFMVSFESPPPPDFPSADDLAVGRSVPIEAQPYAVTDRKETVCLGGEGELPFAAPPGRKGLSVDLTGPQAGFACAEYSETGTRLYAGRYARFDDLKFEGLRPVPGWSSDATEAKQPGTTALNCPKCGATVTLRAAGFSMSAACGSCGALIDTATPDLSLIQEAQKRQRVQPKIPLGRRGVLFGTNFEVIGFQHVKDEFSGWFEYLLFNPWQGFVWLVTYNGHWSFVRRRFEQPEVQEAGIFHRAAHAKFENRDYRIFAAGSAQTDYVLGEFYWKVSVGMPANVTDFVCPPDILSREAYPQLGEVTWSQGEYVAPEVVQAAFNLEEPLPEPTGVYLNQPNPYAGKAAQLKLLVPLLIAVLLLVQLVSASRAARQPVLSVDHTYRAGATNPVVVTPPFEIKGGKQAIEFTLWAPVENHWLEISGDLVNAENFQVAGSFDRVVEFYQGYDDGPWSEGKQTVHCLVPAVPPGKYCLAIDVSADPVIPEIPFRVAAVRDVVVWSNFWIALGLLLVYPLYCWVRAGTFERARWLESDYSPYSSSASSDD